MTRAPAILQVLPALVTGGVERGTVEITEAIAKAGWRALVASAGGPLVPEVERAGGTHITLPLHAKSPVALWRNAAVLAALVRQEEVAILHARSRAPAWSAWLAARRTGAHFVTTYHGAYNEGLPGKRLYNSVMARGERVIAVSRFIAEHIRRTHGTDAARIRIIPRGVDPRRFDPALVPPPVVAALRAAWAVPEGEPVILLPGRITRWKGQAVLVEALANLPRGIAVLAGGGGEGGFRDELTALATARGVADRLRIVGHVADMAAALLAADVVVHASTDPEAFGRTVVEAQAMGRLVVASDLGGPRETVEEGVTGWRVAPGDPAALAAVLDRVLSLSPAQRAAMEAQARAAVLARYTTEAMQQATLQLYREVLA